jgi:hypothetical protein
MTMLRRRGAERTMSFARILVDTLARAGYPLNADS